MEFSPKLWILCPIFVLSAGIVGVTEGTISERGLQSYIRNCHNSSCDYAMSVDMATQNSAAAETLTLTPDLKNEILRLKVLLMNLSQALLKDTQRTDSSIEMLKYNVTSLEEAMKELVGIVNLTLTDQQMMKAEIVRLKSQLSSLSAVIDGKTKNGQPIITRPELSQKDFSEVVGTDCAALYSSGVNVSGIYTIQPDIGNNSYKFSAYCDMEHDGGGWTVIQRRVDGSDDFFRGWESYKLGFGGLLHDFWLGLDKMHLLTKHGNTRLRINLQDWNDQRKFSEFSYVRVADESDGYRILAGKYMGNAGDPFHTVSYNDRMQSMRFSTYDVDNDMDHYGNCALTFTSGWWFNSCFLGNLNGVWYNTGTYRGPVSNGIVWDLWTEHPHGYSLKFTEMKLRPENLNYVIIKEGIN